MGQEIWRAVLLVLLLVLIMQCTMPDIKLRFGVEHINLILWWRTLWATSWRSDSFLLWLGSLLTWPGSWIWLQRCKQHAHGLSIDGCQRTRSFDGSNSIGHSYWLILSRQRSQHLPLHASGGLPCSLCITSTLVQPLHSAASSKD